MKHTGDKRYRIIMSYEFYYVKQHIIRYIPRSLDIS